MQSNLGIYIGKKVIKYAKLQKDNDLVKVEGYNVAFYEEGELENTLKRIISETYSYKIPISINLSDEIYTSFDVSSLLSKQDIKKAIDISYEMFCSEKGYGKNALEHKYTMIDLKGETEKEKTLSVLANKKDITKKTTLFTENKINTLTPIATSITNLIENTRKENIAIINIEEKTQVTIILDGRIFQVDTLDEGMTTILEDINREENSYAKSYEVCKNIMIHNKDTEYYTETNEYTEIITSTLDKVIKDVQTIINNLSTSVDKIYITGLGTCINNIDLYFQDYFRGTTCKILKPYFTQDMSSQLPIKDYIEVNSAIALALDGLGMVNKNLNFAKGKTSSTPNINFDFKKDINIDSVKEYFANFGENVKKDYSQSLKSEEKLLIRGIFACIIAMVMFLGFSKTIQNKIDIKQKEIAAASTSTRAELNKIDSDISLISGRKDAYKNLINEIKNPNVSVDSNTGSSQRIIMQDSIPNLLNRIMFVIPKKVKLTSIKNTTVTHIVIQAEAEKYEQLGYFKAVLTTNGILRNVKSTSGDKSGSVVTVTIEGDLP